MKCVKCNKVIKDPYIDTCAICINQYQVAKCIECCDGNKPTQLELTKQKIFNKEKELVK